MLININFISNLNLLNFNLHLEKNQQLIFFKFDFNLNFMSYLRNQLIN